ncbi:MAG: hypothetical protein Q8P57_05160 [Candidatus Pacearchaeota archaeon]|nr:hypothetical protein [Candidatus Pacearchaeota archaeon]
MIESNRGKFRGSTPFLSMLVDEMLAPSAGVAQLIDLSDPRVFRQVKYSHYTDTPAFVLLGTGRGYRGAGRGYERSLPIFGELADRVGDLRTPVLVTGLKVDPWMEDEKGYGLRVVPTVAFQAQADDRLSPKWNGYNFDKADEKGFPLNLDREKGSRTWHTSDRNLSGLCLNRSLRVGSYDEDIANSDEDGRVVVVSRGAGVLEMKGILQTEGL